MIAKRIMAPKGGAGFGRLGAYVLNARAEVDPASWTRLNAYILDSDRAGEKVAWARVTNCQADDPGWAVKEILATQAHNSRSRSDKSYHLVVSFPEGEKPSREQMEDIEDQLCAAIGFEAHQRVSAVHQNTDNWHLHVAINKVHPRTSRNVTPVRDHYRLQEACSELEIRHGLTREPHTVDPRQSADRRQRKARGRAADFEAQHGGQSFGTWVREQAAAALLAARDSGKGWPELHRVAASYDLEIKPRGAGLVIGHRGDGRLHVKASDVDRGLSMQALTAVLGPFEPSGRQGPAEPEPAQSRYARPSRSGPLYEAFQRERAAAVAAREAATKALREQHALYGQQLRAYHRDRLRRERLTGLRGMLRRDSFQHLAERGQSVVAFAFTRLLGFQLLPRLKPIGKQCLYRPEAGQPDAYPRLQPVLLPPMGRGRSGRDRSSAPLRACGDAIPPPHRPPAAGPANRLAQECREAHSATGSKRLGHSIRAEDRLLQMGRLSRGRNMSVRKALVTSLAILLAGGLASIPPARMPAALAQDLPQAGVGEDATAAVARMSKTLLARQFSFNSRTIRSYAGPNGELLHIAHQSKIVFRRPDRLSVDVTGDDGSIKMLYDGKAIVLYGVEQKKYMSLAVTGGIFKALDAVQERTGTDFPLADLLSDDPGRSVLSGVTSGGQVGMVTIDGVRCRHFFFVQAPDDLEFELWLEDNDQSLPRRFVVTYRSLPGRPIFIAELSDWNFAVQTPDSEFEFKPPPGVTQVELGPPTTPTPK